MTRYVSVTWRRLAMVSPAKGPCGGGPHPGLASRDLVVRYQVPGYSGAVPVCAECDEAILLGERSWATTYGQEGDAYLVLATAEEVGARGLSGLPSGTSQLYAHVTESVDGDPPTYLTAWQDALTFALAHPIEAVALLAEMDAAVGDWTDDDRLEDPGGHRERLFARLVAVLASAVVRGGQS